MLMAQCPDCGTAFKVTLSELAVADGQLQCGQCQALFHAEDPIIGSNELTGSVAHGSGLQGSFDEPAAHAVDEDLDALDLDLDAVSQDQVTLSPTSAAQLAASNTTEGPNDSSDEEVVRQGPLEAKGLDAAAAVSVQGESDSVVPGTLMRMSAKVRSWLLPGCLLGFLVLQLIWVGAERALSHPVLYGMMAGSCQVFGCHLPPFQDVARLELGDVSMSPWSNGRAEVSASLVNKADRNQGLPILRFVLQDNEARDLGQKLLMPGLDYQLRDPVLDRLEPEQPHLLVFEVVEQKAYAQAASYRLELVNPL